MGSRQKKLFSRLFHQSAAATRGTHPELQRTHGRTCLRSRPKIAGTPSPDRHARGRAVSAHEAIEFSTAWNPLPQVLNGESLQFPGCGSMPARRNAVTAVMECA